MGRLETWVGGHGLDLAVLDGEDLERRLRAGIAAEGIEEGVIAGPELVAPVAVKIGCQAAVRHRTRRDRPSSSSAILAGREYAGVGAAMRAAGIERHHDLRVAIAGIDLGDLHATGGMPKPVHRLRAWRSACRRRTRPRRRAHDVAVLALLLDVAQRRLHRALRDLLRTGSPSSSSSSSPPPASIFGASSLPSDVGGLEIFRVGRFDGLGKARRRICGALMP